MLLIKDIKLSLNEKEEKLKEIVKKRLKCKVSYFEIHKKSIDARKDPHYVYSVIVEVKNEERYLGKNIEKYEKKNLNPKYKENDKICAIIGYGPSGIFSAYRLMQAGFKVLVFEKGKRIKERVEDVETFFKTGKLDEKSNVQFGEGGAGTFSDAKLTTRIKDPYIEYMLDIFVRHGAKPSIKYENHAHIGTDEIRIIIANITDYLIDKGVEFHFKEEVKDLEMDENRNIRCIITDNCSYKCDHVLLGIGHSAYDSVKLLQNKNVYIEKKDIAIGFRVEHRQSMINQRQSNNLIAQANEYFLRYKSDKGVYSFCMCPGGIVIPAMSVKDSIVTNGMSYALRDSSMANSAILIQVFKDEFTDGFEFLRNIERKAFDYSSSYKALSQNIRDFMNDELNELIFDSTYPLGTVLYNFNDLFKESDLRILKEAFIDFDKKIPGFIDSGIMVGPETRSSCPIRILRNEQLVSVNTPNLYPMGEGAGYGGGIMSCGLDGIRIANRIISKYE